jgi:molecular chaperone DnaK
MNYVGIDLGTTNSAICSYDGEQTRIWKSPEQNDVTPSAIYIGRRGNKYVGKRAYDSAARNPDNTATLFKPLRSPSRGSCPPGRSLRAQPTKRFSGDG